MFVGGEHSGGDRSGLTADLNQHKTKKICVTGTEVEQEPKTPYYAAQFNVKYEDKTLHLNLKVTQKYISKDFQGFDLNGLRRIFQILKERVRQFRRVFVSH